MCHEDRVDLNTQTEVIVKDVEGSIGASPTKSLRDTSTNLPRISTQMQANC